MSVLKKTAGQPVAASSSVEQSSTGTEAPVTLSRADFERILDALCTAISATVAIDEIGEALARILDRVLDRGTGLTYALDSVCRRAEDKLCNAEELLRSYVGGDNDA